MNGLNQAVPGLHINSNGNTQSAVDAAITVDVLIVGAGPAGASLACFLSSYGITGIVISRASGTADTPRAHITNMAAMECLRDIGLEFEAEKVAIHGQNMLHTRWCNSMAGEEYARVYSWGNDPKRMGDYVAASPCKPCDLPQTLLEPILVQYALRNGYQVRFNTTFLAFTRDQHGYITTTVQDDISRSTYNIRSRYLFGADGARSRVAKQLNLPFDIGPGCGLAINVLIKADLSHLMANRMGNLHWILQPEVDHPDYSWMGIARMVKPWHEWLFILLPKPEIIESQEPSKDDYRDQIRSFIGDDTPVEILSVSKWYINETAALRYSEEDNIFCLGDAVHRHPPFNGLGSNTCIQDAFNLAWKVAYTVQRSAGPKLLASYTTERQPVGHRIVKRANQSFRDHRSIWETIGNVPIPKEQRRAMFSELSHDSENGKKRRKAFQDAILNSRHEFHALGVEMGQSYDNSTAIYGADEVAPYKPSGLAAEDPDLYYEPSTFPGRRLPHAWLNTAIPGKLVSTIDLAGHGNFVLLTGVGGDVWKKAVVHVSQELGVPLKGYSIGFRQDLEDVYFDWARLRSVGESGAILVRPDRFVAWRSESAPGSTAACSEVLTRVLRATLNLT